MTPDESRAYAAWFERARPLLDAARWSEAMRDVPTLGDLEPASPRPLRRSLAEATIGLITSAGLSAPGQPPMDGTHIEGDYSIRLLDANLPASEILIWHTHFDTTSASQDVNVVYPMDRLKELVSDGTIARVASPGVSFMGYFSNVFRMRDEVAPAVVAAMREARADGVVLVPV